MGDKVIIGFEKAIAKRRGAKKASEAPRVDSEQLKKETSTQAKKKRKTQSVAARTASLANLAKARAAKTN